MKKKMLITGVSGLLGSNLAYYNKRKYDVLGLYNRHAVNITDVWTVKCDYMLEGILENTVTSFAPDVIINCSAIADIELCERDKEMAELVNVDAPRRLVDLADEREVKLVHISTDAVYDGAVGKSAEDSLIRPLNVYASSKRAAELVLSGCSTSFVLRTNFFGLNIQNKESLAEWALKSLRAGTRIPGFFDACFSSIYTLELARVLDMAIERDLAGVFNCGSSDCCSKYEFLKKLSAVFGLDSSLIDSLSVEQSSLGVSRGKDLSMDVGKLEAELGYKLPTIEQSLDMFYRDEQSALRERLGSISNCMEDRSAFLSYGRQSIDSEDVDSVVSVLRSPWLTQGPKIAEFEEAIASLCGADHAVAVTSGTAALHLACLALGVTEGDEVITTPNTFVASANCAVYCGAKPVFADIDSSTYNIAITEIEKKISSKTKVVIPVHFAGQSCDIRAIRDVLDRAEEKFGHRIYIIEDASHALGSFFKGAKVGSCCCSDLAVTSFHPVKHVTTGEGGVVLTNSDTLGAKVRKLRSHGITSTPSELLVQGEHGPWYYEQQDLGYNYRITDIQCALGLSQLRRFSVFVDRRRKIVNRYNSAFRGVEHICIPYEEKDANSNFHLYVLKFDFSAIGIERGKFMSQLRERNIGTQVHYIPVHTQPYYKSTFGTKWGDCPVVEDYYSKCLSIPLYPAMTDCDVDYVVETILDLIGVK